MALQLSRWQLRQPGPAAALARALAAAASSSGGGGGSGGGSIASTPAGALWCVDASAHIRWPYSSAAVDGGPAGLPPVPHYKDGPGQRSAAPASGTGGGPGSAIRRVQLVRHFIHDSLYHPTEGYFSKRTATGTGVVGSLPQPLEFNSMQGQTEYLLAVQALYKELQASWLTPVEIFQPHYGRAIAESILQRWNEQAADAVAAGHPEPPLRIYEIGGGTGTLARNILDWLRAKHPAAYARCQYACIEISPVLAAIQRRKVATEGGHGGRFTVRQHDAADRVSWEVADEAAARSAGGSSSSSSPEWQREHAFIVMCEVLDNMPHDRVWRDMGSTEWQQTLVAEGDRYENLADWHTHHQRGGEGDHFELLQPVSDPLIRRCLQAVQSSDDGPSSQSGSRKSRLALSAARAWRKLVGEATDEVRWLPTGCLQLLDTLQEARPSHTLIAADFDQLPEVAVAGVNAPLVATTVGGTTVDHGSYLLPRGTADIFFPTDFPLLCTLYREAAQHGGSSSGRGSSNSRSSAPGKAVRAEHMGTADFMMRYSPDLAATRTASGYNPLLEDYSNSAFFVGSCLWERAFFVGTSTSGGGSSGGRK